MLMNMLEETDTSGLLTEEQECLQFLIRDRPELVQSYKKMLRNGRQGMLRKLAASLLREDIIGLYSQSITLNKIGSVLVVGFEGVNDSWKGLLRQLQKQTIREDLSYRIYRLGKSLLLFPIEKEYAYGRVMVTDDILLIKEKQVEVVETAGELLSILSDKLPAQVRNVKEELDNGTANYILALAYLESWSEHVKKDSTQRNLKSSLEYVRAKQRKQHNWSPALFFEQLATEGHHLHPGAKTKTGMAPEDVFRYAPEFGQKQSIRFIALKRDKLLVNEEGSDYIETAFPDAAASCRKQLEEMGRSLDEYRMIPVHEWQFEQVIPSMYAEDITIGDLILLENIAVEGTASSSFRTVWPTTVGKPSLKLAVNSQMTSTVRSISTQTAMNACTFTKMMREILEKEPELDRFLPINEIAGYSFLSNRTDQSRNLSVVVRESLDPYLSDGETAIAGCSLYNRSPITGKTILAEIVDEYCQTTGLLEEEGTLSFLDDYLSITIPGYLTLMSKYGVALEGHLQNSVPVFKNGQPTRFYFRDWGGARIYLPRLHEQGIKADFYPGSVSVTDDEVDMWNKLYYTVFQNQFGELIVQLCQYSGVSEHELWKKVRESCEECFTSLLKKGVAAVQRDSERLFRPEVEHKALMKMRLFPDQGYCFSMVPNPLNRLEEAD